MLDVMIIIIIMIIVLKPLKQSPKTWKRDSMNKK